MKGNNKRAERGLAILKNGKRNRFIKDMRIYSRNKKWIARVQLFFTSLSGQTYVISKSF